MRGVRDLSRFRNRLPSTLSSCRARWCWLRVRLTSFRPYFHIRVVSDSKLQRFVDICQTDGPTISKMIGEQCFLSLSVRLKRASSAFGDAIQTFVDAQQVGTVAPRDLLVGSLANTVLEQDADRRSDRRGLVIISCLAQRDALLGVPKWRPDGPRFCEDFSNGISRFPKQVTKNFHRTFGFFELCES